jgi:hypothetical protein
VASRRAPPPRRGSARPGRSDDSGARHQFAGDQCAAHDSKPADKRDDELLGKQYGYLIEVDTGARIGQQFLP